MKTDFLMLWVDDRRLLIEALTMSLKIWLDTKGFELNIIMRPDKKNVLDDIKNRAIELIIVDYRLNEETTGDTIIREIRDSGCYQDIVFYSENELPTTRFDGVFYVHKQDDEARIKELIELKLWRASDPSSIRGWIVADAIELESIVTDILGLCFTQREGYTFSKRFFHDHNAPIDFGRKVDILKGILNDLIDWIKTLSEKDEARLKKLEDCNKIFKDFKEQVVEVRNAVAHQKAEVTDAGLAIKKKTSKAELITLEDATFVQIRNNLRKHHKNLSELLGLL